MPRKPPTPITKAFTRPLLSIRTLFPVSAHETDRVVSAKESFWSIVTPRSDDETEADDAHRFGGRSDQGHPPADAAALLRRGQDQDRARGPAWRRQHFGAVPPRGDRVVAILRLVQGVPGGRQAASGGG